MLMKFGKLPSFGNHAFRIKCDDLTADRTTDKLAYFNETVMESDPCLLGYKLRIGRDTGQYTPLIYFFDFIHIRCINKIFH